MKHLKIYEENNKPLYKKYIVTDFSPYHSKESMSCAHYIFNVLPKSTEDLLYYDTFYSILNGNLKMSKDTNYYAHYKNKIFDILYQTNSLKDASDFLFTLQDVNKYNL